MARSDSAPGIHSLHTRGRALAACPDPPAGAFCCIGKAAAVAGVVTSSAEKTRRGQPAGTPTMGLSPTAQAMKAGPSAR